VGWPWVCARSGLLSKLRRGVPVLIVVATVWFIDVSVSRAAAWRAGMMAGPGRRCAFVRWAQEDMRSGPCVYWDCTVSARSFRVNKILQ